MKKTFATIMLVSLVAALPLGSAGPLENHQAVRDGADRLLAVQFDETSDDAGAMPWIVGFPQAYMNVQGITAQGFLDAYKVTLDPAYLDGAKGVRDWLEAYMNENPTGFVSSANVYFLAEFALLSGNHSDLDLARAALQRSIDDPRWDDTPEGLAEYILALRAVNYDNLGIWDVALFARAAQDIGNTSAADAFAGVLQDQVDTQSIVDPFDPAAKYYELGLAGLLFGLGEAGALDHQATIDAAAMAIKAAQSADGSWGESVQDTAFAVLGLTTVLHLAPEAQAGCTWLESAQTDADDTTYGGGWDLGGYELAEVDSEAVQALAACVAPAHNAVVAYSDGARSLLPV